MPFRGGEGTPEILWTDRAGVAHHEQVNAYVTGRGGYHTTVVIDRDGQRECRDPEANSCSFAPARSPLTIACRLPNGMPWAAPRHPVMAAVPERAALLKRACASGRGLAAAQGLGRANAALPSSSATVR